ncbi:MAG: trypsin-like peptidase domain-containing protein, partial [Pirellulales bacterium]|nr:trypsin-like peptidase domain-containing protein [Pirellulales bacterium]
MRAVRDAGPAVVNIQGQKSVSEAEEGAPSAPRQVNGMGTGVVIDPRGYILTNHHVVDGVRRINITLAGGQTYVAQIVAYEKKSDLAIIRIRTPSLLPVIHLGTSEDLMEGETVIAMGNAFGYEHTVTTGIISALHRNVQVNETQQYLDLIQTDASINPGNSGGPLLNIDGEMVGVNVAVRAGAQGIGFAIPIDKALEIATRLLSIEKLDNHWHGMTALSLDGP